MTTIPPPSGPSHLAPTSHAQVPPQPVILATASQATTPDSPLTPPSDSPSDSASTPPNSLKVIPYVWPTKGEQLDHNAQRQHPPRKTQAKHVSIDMVSAPHHGSAPPIPNFYAEGDYDHTQAWTVSPMQTPRQQPTLPLPIPHPQEWQGLAPVGVYTFQNVPEQAYVQAQPTPTQISYPPPQTSPPGSAPANLHPVNPTQPPVRPPRRATLPTIVGPTTAGGTTWLKPPKDSATSSSSTAVRRAKGPSRGMIPRPQRRTPLQHAPQEPVPYQAYQWDEYASEPMVHTVGDGVHQYNAYREHSYPGGASGGEIMIVDAHTAYTPPVPYLQHKYLQQGYQQPPPNGGYSSCPMTAQQAPWQLETPPQPGAPKPPQTNSTAPSGSGRRQVVLPPHVQQAQREARAAHANAQANAGANIPPVPAGPPPAHEGNAVVMHTPDGPYQWLPGSWTKVSSSPSPAASNIASRPDTGYTGSQAFLSPFGGQPMVREGFSSPAGIVVGSSPLPLAQVLGSSPTFTTLASTRPPTSGSVTSQPPSTSNGRFKPTEAQLEILRQASSRGPYPDAETRAQIMHHMPEVSAQSIAGWFNARRMAQSRSFNKQGRGRKRKAQPTSDVDEEDEEMAQALDSQSTSVSATSPEEPSRSAEVSGSQELITTPETASQPAPNGSPIVQAPTPVKGQPQLVVRSHAPTPSLSTSDVEMLALCSIVFDTDASLSVFPIHRFGIAGWSRLNNPPGCSPCIAAAIRPNPAELILYTMFNAQTYRVTMPLLPAAVSRVHIQMSGSQAQMSLDAVQLMCTLHPGVASFHCWGNGGWMPRQDFTGGRVTGGGTVELVGPREALFDACSRLQTMLAAGQCLGLGTSSPDAVGYASQEFVAPSQDYSQLRYSQAAQEYHAQQEASQSSTPAHTTAMHLQAPTYALLAPSYHGRWPSPAIPMVSTAGHAGYPAGPGPQPPTETQGSFTFHHPTNAANDDASASMLSMMPSGEAMFESVADDQLNVLHLGTALTVETYPWPFPSFAGGAAADVTGSALPCEGAGWVGFGVEGGD